MRRLSLLPLSVIAMLTVSPSASHGQNERIKPGSPKLVIPVPTLEAEDMAVKALDGAASVQDMSGFGPDWGEGRQLFWRPTKYRGILQARFKTTATGLVKPVLHYTLAPDYGIVRVSIDGVEVGAYDGYSESVVHTRTQLRAVTLEAGKEHLLQVEVIGRNDSARQWVGNEFVETFLVGIDRLALVPAVMERRAGPASVSAGFCKLGGAHEGESGASWTLGKYPRSDATYRWCLKCGALFHEKFNATWIGGACPVDFDPAHKSAPPFVHSGKFSPGYLVEVADLVDEKLQIARTCWGCKGIHIKWPTPIDAKYICPAGNEKQHTAVPGGALRLRASTDPGTAIFRHCTGCQVVFALADKAKLVCPVFGTHKPGAEAYALNTPPEGTQFGWLKCHKCRALFFSQNWPPSMGLCPAGGPHDGHGSASYFPKLGARSSDPKAWRACFECWSLYRAEWGGVGCPRDGKPHRDYVPNTQTQSGDYLPAPTTAASDAGWHRCVKCSVLFDVR